MAVKHHLGTRDFHSSGSTRLARVFPRDTSSSVLKQKRVLTRFFVYKKATGLL